MNKKYANDLQNVPGGQNFSDYFRIFSQNISAIDRTNILKFPLKTKVLPFMRLPKMIEFNKSFGDICDERAEFLMHRVKHDGRKLAVMYSGGIDSTAILCSLLKNCSKEDLKNHVVVLLSHVSINENPNFYYDHVVKYFECVSSYRFPLFLGNDDYMFISGENADQLFGSQVVGEYSKMYSYSDMKKPIGEVKDRIINWMGTKVKSRKDAEYWFDRLKQIVDAAPIPIDTAYKFFWWVNFTTKWQSVYVRILAFAQNQDNIKLEDNYTTFFSTTDFQLWALNNSDTIMADVPSMSKSIAKQYILDYNGDESYLLKPKIGSLGKLARQKSIPMTISNDMIYDYNYPGDNLYNYDNDFMKTK
jgi:hypothetical protein